MIVKWVQNGTKICPKSNKNRSKTVPGGRWVFQGGILALSGGILGFMGGHWADFGIHLGGQNDPKSDKK